MSAKSAELTFTAQNSSAVGSAGAVSAQGHRFADGLDLGAERFSKHAGQLKSSDAKVPPKRDKSNGTGIEIRLRFRFANSI